MADLIYNPLLKKGFQETSDTGSIEAEIDDLKQHKITKCLTVAELDGVTDGEIFEWQGEDTITPATLKNGFFYKKTGTPQILPAGTQYFNNPSNTINLYNYNVIPGNFYLIEDLTPEESSNFFNYHIKVFEGNSRYKFVTLNNDYNVGDKVWDNQEQNVLTITSITYDANFQKVINLSNGASFLSTYSTMHIFNRLYKFVDERLNEFFIVNCQEMFVWVFLHYTIDGNNFNILDWFAIDYEPLQITTTPTIIGTPTYTQTDTQPRTPGIKVVDGVLQISLPVEFSGNITVHGSEVIVTTEQIQSEKDFIKLRYNNPLALASGETSGISVNNYDGNNSDCLLAVDKDGWARIGDSSGTLQKLATIEENPTDGGFTTYNATDKELQTTTDGSDLNVNFTGTFKITQNIFSGNSLADMFRIIHGGLFTCQYTTDNIYNTIKSLIANSIRVGCISAQETTQAYLPAGNDEAYCVLFFKTDMGNTVPLLAIGYVVNKVFISHFNITQSYTSFTWVQL